MASPRLTACGAALAAALGVGALVHSQAPGPDIPKGTHVLTGRVLDSSKDAPVAGAVVSITGYFDPAGHPIAPALTGRAEGASAPRSAVTNGDGYFFFSELPAAKYSIVANAFGYVSSGYPLKIVELNDGDRPTAIQLRIAKFAAISGTVLDESGEAVAGVPVIALQRVVSGGGLVLRSTNARSETDDRGIYRIAQLPPGSYVVGVLSATTSLPASVAADIDAGALQQARGSLFTDLLATSAGDISTGVGARVGDVVVQRTGPTPTPASGDGKMLAYATTFAPGTSVPSEAVVVVLGSGDQRTGVDVPLRLVPTVRVSGVATGPDGPMKNLAVRLMPPSGVDTADYDPAGVATAVTDASGAFTFPLVTPGSYTLHASFVNGGRPGTDNPTDVSLWTAQPLTVADADISGLAVTMRPGFRVSGRVEFKGAAESPLDSQPMLVALRPVGAQAWRSLRGVVGPDGSFTTPGDPPGRYVVYTQAPPGWTWQSLSRGGTVVMDDVIEIDNGDLSGLVLTFSKESNLISGSIVGSGGAADGEADVVIFPADSTLWREGIFNTRRVRSVHATSSGSFAVPGLAPGDYYVAAVDSQLTADRDDPVFYDRLIPGATKITLGEGETKTIQLKTFTPKAP